MTKTRGPGRHPVIGSGCGGILPGGLALLLSVFILQEPSGFAMRALVAGAGLLCALGLWLALLEPLLEGGWKKYHLPPVVFRAAIFAWILYVSPAGERPTALGFFLITGLVLAGWALLLRREQRIKNRVSDSCEELGLSLQSEGSDHAVVYEGHLDLIHVQISFGRQPWTTAIRARGQRRLGFSFSVRPNPTADSRLEGPGPLFEKQSVISGDADKARKLLEPLELQERIDRLFADSQAQASIEDHTVQATVRVKPNGPNPLPEAVRQAVGIAAKLGRRAEELDLVRHNPLQVRGSEIIVHSDKLSPWLPLSRQVVFPLGEDDICLREGDELLARFRLAPIAAREGDRASFLHARIHVSEEYQLRIEGLTGPSRHGLERPGESEDVSVILQPFFLGPAREKNRETAGLSPVQRGLHTDQASAPRWSGGREWLVCVCDHCRHSFCLQSRPAYSWPALYLYCQTGTHMLFLPLTGGPDRPGPDFVPEQKTARELEKGAGKCPRCRTPFRLDHPLRCPACGQAYMDLANTPDIRRIERRAFEMVGSERS